MNNFHTISIIKRREIPLPQSNHNLTLRLMQKFLQISIVNNNTENVKEMMYYLRFSNDSDALLLRTTDSSQQEKFCRFFETAFIRILKT